MENDTNKTRLCTHIVNIDSWDVELTGGFPRWGKEEEVYKSTMSISIQGRVARYSCDDGNESPFENEPATINISTTEHSVITNAVEIGNNTGTLEAPRFTLMLPFDDVYRIFMLLANLQGNIQVEFIIVEKDANYQNINLGYDRRFRDIQQYSFFSVD